MSFETNRVNQLVEANLHLVRVHLSRYVRLPRQPSRHGDYDDLYQEGVLALMAAARTYEVATHGAFAGYALARIRYAVSHYLYEGFRVVRIPATVQKTHREKASGVGLPGEVRVAWPDELDDRANRWRHRPEAETVGDLWMVRYRKMVRTVQRVLKQSPRCRPDRARLVDRFVEEWLLVPEPSARIAKRELAREMDCSVGRINGLERRFKCDVAQLLIDDKQAQRLCQMARVSDNGWREAASDDAR